MSFQEIKPEPLGEEDEGANEDLNKSAYTFVLIMIEDKIPIKEESKGEMKPKTSKK